MHAVIYNIVMQLTWGLVSTLTMRDGAQQPVSTV